MSAGVEVQGMCGMDREMVRHPPVARILDACEAAEGERERMSTGVEVQDMGGLDREVVRHPPVARVLDACEAAGGEGGGG